MVRKAASDLHNIMYLERVYISHMQVKKSHFQVTGQIFKSKAVIRVAYYNACAKYVGQLFQSFSII